MQINNEQDILELIKKLTSKILPEIIRQYNTSIKTGTISNINTITRTVDVQIAGGDFFRSVKYSKGINSPLNGERCLVISPDPKNKNLNFVVGVF